MSKAEVSVLMPVYNGEAYLREAIDSIVSQSYTDWELILINDGSTDDTAAIIADYSDSRIHYIANEQNIGLIATLNKGIDICTGKYIARMDADDIALPDRLAKQVAFMESNNDYILCGANVAVIDDKGNRTGKILNFSNSELLRIHLLFSVPFVHPTVLFRAEVLKENRYDAGYKHVEDYELWTRMARKGQLSNLQDTLLLYRWHDSNVSVTNADYQKEQKGAIMRKSLSHFGLNPTDEELRLHMFTFYLYQMDGLAIDKATMQGVEDWFVKLIDANKRVRVYNQAYFIAFLWSRWIVLCAVAKCKIRMLTPRFASYNPRVLIVLLKIVRFLKEK